MMKHLNRHLYNLNSRLQEVQKFIQSIELQKKLSAEYKSIDSDFAKRSSSLEELVALYHDLNNSTVQYNAVIISLYACFENYIDDIAKELVGFYSANFQSFDDLPQKITSRYFTQIGEYLTNPQRYGGVCIEPKEIISIAYNNFLEGKNEPLKHEFLIKHSGNLKMDKVAELFSSLEVKNFNARLKNNYLFKAYISETKDMPIDDVTTYLAKATDIFLPLDKLVDARNTISHGWNEDSRISYSTIIDEIIPFSRCLCKAILEEVMCSMFECLLKQNKYFPFDPPIDVFNKTILCINSKESKLELGDYLFFEISNNTFGVSTVLTIEKDKESLTFSSEPNVDIGICLDKPVKKSYQFYYSKNN